MTTRDNADTIIASDGTISLADATRLGLLDWWGNDPDDPPGASLRAPAPVDVGDPHERVGATLSDGTLADDAEGPADCGHDWPGAWAGPCADCCPGRGPDPDELRDLAEQMPEPTPAEAELLGRLVARAERRARVRQLAGALAFGLLFGLATVAVRVGDPGSASVLLLGCAAMLDGGVAW